VLTGRRKTQGILLVELLFAVGVLAVAGLWLFGAFTASLQLTSTSQEAAVAIEDMKDMLERIRSTAFNANLPTTFPDGINGNGVIGGGPDAGTGADQYPTIVGVDTNGDGVREFTLLNQQIAVTYRDQNGNTFAGTAAQKQTAIAAEIQAQRPLQIMVTVSWSSLGRTYTKTVSTIKSS